MAVIEFDKLSERFYETGVDHCVLFPVQEGGLFNKGVAWNGVSAFNEKPTGAEATPVWADNIKYLNMESAEDFTASISAYTYPDEFDECNGLGIVGVGGHIGQQGRKMFGLCVRTLVGNADKGNDYGYKLHFVYGCKAAPTEMNHSSVNDNPEAIEMSWEITTTPITVKGYKPTAHFVVDSTKLAPEKLKAIEDLVYGTVEADAKLPTPDELITIITGVGA